MIRINLLSVKRKKKIQPLPAVLIYGAVVFSVMIGVFAIFTFILAGKVSNMKDDVAVKEITLKELRVQLKEVENYERDNEDYRRKSQIIVQLKKNQNVPLRLLDEVSIQLPEGVWLTALTNTGGAVDMKGYAFTNSDLVGYVQQLKKSKYVMNVELLESKQTKIEDISLYQFKVTFRMKV